MNDNKQGELLTDSNIGQTSKLSWFFRNEVILVIIMIVLSIIITVINPRFLSLANLFNIISSASVIGIATIGASMVLIMGEFDLTLGALISIQGWLMALLTPTYGATVGIAAALLAGVVFGAFTGLIVNYVKANSFIVTLALATVYTGVGLLLNKGAYSSMSGYFTVFKERLFGIIPYSIIILIVFLVIAALIFKFTKFGRTIFLIGSNQQAAYLSGIRVRNYKILVFAIAGVLYGIASVVLVSQISVAMNYLGEPYTLAAIAAAVLGGVVLGGGRGNVLGIFLGVALFGLVTNGMILMNLRPYWRGIVIGAIILIALTASGYARSKE
jgi:ribose/xylose/arabinose/galactoside ABC-type transport system permease subunit